MERGERAAGLPRWVVAKPLSGKAVFALWSRVVDEILSRIGFAVCHQLPGHTLSFGGRLMPLCARCTGIYAGLFFTVLLLLALGRVRRTQLPPVLAVALGVGFFAAMAADAFSALLGWRETNNALRLATGVLTGIALLTLGLPLANSTVRELGGIEAIILSSGEFTIISVTGLALTLFAQVSSLYFFKAFSMISVIGLIVFLLGINSIPLAGFLKGKWQFWIVPGSLALSAGELVLLAVFHRWLLRMLGSV